MFLKSQKATTEALRHREKQIDNKSSFLRVSVPLCLNPTFFTKPSIMDVIVFFIAGIIISGILTWFFGKLLLHRVHSKELSDLRMHYANQTSQLEARARSSEAVVGELRQLVLQKDRELEQIRAILDSERQEKTEALTKLDAAQKGFDEQKSLIETMKREMTDTFNALSSAALKSSSEDFLRLASESLGRVVTDTRGRLENTRQPWTA